MQPPGMPKMTSTSAASRERTSDTAPVTVSIGAWAWVDSPRVVRRSLISLLRRSSWAPLPGTPDTERPLTAVG